MVEFSGAAFAGEDNRLMSLALVQKGLVTYRVEGRSLSAKILATASGFDASAASPYTVSVGMTMSSPARRRATA